MAAAKKASSKLSDEEQVMTYMNKLEHPLKKEIEAIRKIIKSNTKIAERIKWNAPSYHYKDDLVTFHVRPTEYLHLVFHHPTIVKIKSPLLQGDYKDRRMMYLKNMKEVKANKTALQQIINQLIDFIDNQNK